MTDFFKTLDTKKKGYLTKEDMEEISHIISFNDCDKNKDKKVTKEEFDQTLKDQKKKRNNKNSLDIKYSEDFQKEKKKKKQSEDILERTLQEESHQMMKKDDPFTK